MSNVVLEIPYEGDHCAPCVYMLETAEEAVSGLGQGIMIELLFLRQAKGALRYNELSSQLGRPAPIPSIFLNGRLLFEVIPGVDDLREAIKELMAPGVL